MYVQNWSHGVVGFGLAMGTNGGSTWTYVSGVSSSILMDNYWRGSFAISPSNHSIACIHASMKCKEVVMPIKTSEDY